jgi:CTP synthase (UTP-ammonia lyase)
LIELARNVAKTPNATNEEFDKNAGINVLSFIKKSREYTMTL